MVSLTRRSPVTADMVEGKQSTIVSWEMPR
jgi:hypothetical protein